MARSEEAALSSSTTVAIRISPCEGSVGESFCTASGRFGREKSSRLTTVSDAPALAIAALGIAAERCVTRKGVWLGAAANKAAALFPSAEF